MACCCCLYGYRGDLNGGTQPDVAIGGTLLAELSMLLLRSTTQSGTQQ